MLTTDFEIDQEGITVPYPPLFDEIRMNYGFVDLRGKPDVAARIPECAQSSALRELLVELAKPDAVWFTLGCDLGSHEEPLADEGRRHVAGGYIQLMHVGYADRCHDDYASMGQIIAARLDDQADDYDWTLCFAPSFVDFKLDGFSDLTSSLWIWFWAAAQTPQAADDSRETFLSSLLHILADESINFFDK